MGNKEAVKKLLGMLKGYRKIIALIIACLLISTGLNMCIPLLSRGIMDYGFIGGDKELLIKQVIGSLLDTYLNIVHALESSPMVLMSQQHPKKHIERFAFMMNRCDEREIEFALHMIEQILRGQEDYLSE